MTDSHSIEFEADTGIFRVTGELTFATVNNILGQAHTLFEPINTLDIDLTEVTRSDSAGLALLITWMRSAKNSNKKIVFHNIPSQMLAIANASGLVELLPLQ
ncbi:MAG: STAS domain-containing protein [Gammaproteobacteria bacterium]|nr:STAS domain-containing protein [Gammaproteobacteria bacterium]